jgi:hypothetical protein
MPRIRFSIAALFGALALLPAAANAASSTNKDERIMRAVEEVVTEHRIYATCLALDPLSLSLVQEGWNREVRDGVDALKEIGASADLAARFATAVAPSQLLDVNMSLSNAIEFCKTNHDRVATYYKLGATKLAPAIRQASGKNR